MSKLDRANPPPEAVAHSIGYGVPGISTTPPARKRGMSDEKARSVAVAYLPTLRQMERKFDAGQSLSARLAYQNALRAVIADLEGRR